MLTYKVKNMAGGGGSLSFAFLYRETLKEGWGNSFLPRAIWIFITSFMGHTVQADEPQGANKKRMSVPSCTRARHYDFVGPSHGPDASHS